MWALEHLQKSWQMTSLHSLCGSQELKSGPHDRQQAHWLTDLWPQTVNLFLEQFLKSDIGFKKQKHSCCFHMNFVNLSLFSKYIINKATTHCSLLNIVIHFQSPCYFSSTHLNRESGASYFLAFFLYCSPLLKALYPLFPYPFGLKMLKDTKPESGLWNSTRDDWQVRPRKQRFCG